MSIDRLQLQAPMPDQSVTDFQGLRNLKARATRDAPAALEAVAQQFEALFLNMMLDSMRAATIDGGLDDSGEGELYQQLFDRQIASGIASGEGIGIARMLVEQLSRSIPGAKRPVADPPARAIGDSTAAAGGAGEPGGGSPARFIREVLPHARRAAADLGVDPMALVAQAALETGWGARLPRRADGSSSMNLFGVKAGGSWSGERVAAGTLEFEGGLPARRVEQFRAYDSVGQSFDDYVQLLRGSPRYAAALEAGGDPARYAEALQAAGYATDPDYAAKLRAILASEPIAAARSALKDPDAGPIT